MSVLFSFVLSYEKQLLLFVVPTVLDKHDPNSLSLRLIVSRFSRVRCGARIERPIPTIRLHPRLALKGFRHDYLRRETTQDPSCTITTHGRRRQKATERIDGID
jgi:hypothetical protein